MDSESPRPSEGAPFLSVVIPAYDEEARLPATLERVQAYLAAQDFSSELLVVDDGSQDRTAEVAEGSFETPGCRLLRNPENVGKGASVRRGMLAARGDWRLFSDADLSTPIEELAKLLRAVEAGHDVAIGSRALRDSSVEIHQPFYRETMGKIFNLIVRVVALSGIKDTQCGFKLFSREAAEHVFRRQGLDGWCFDVEVLALARRRGFSIVEVPVRWLNSPATRVLVFRDSLRMLRDLFRIRWGRTSG